MFADDTKIYGPAADHMNIQNDLLALMDWSNIWLLTFNIIKCGVLHYGYNKILTLDYYMDCNQDKKLQVITTEKDLGVTFSKNLKFDEHINKIVNKANQMTGLIKRTFTYLDKNMFLKLYKSIVRPHLEYANVIWHPILKRQRKLIEQVQRRATKIPFELKLLSYSERLKILDLTYLALNIAKQELI